jgi:hypothetical protein
MLCVVESIHLSSLLSKLVHAVWLFGAALGIHLKTTSRKAKGG